MERERERFFFLMVGWLAGLGQSGIGNFFFFFLLLLLISQVGGEGRGGEGGGSVCPDLKWGKGFEELHASRMGKKKGGLPEFKMIKVGILQSRLDICGEKRKKNLQDLQVV